MLEMICFTFIIEVCILVVQIMIFFLHGDTISKKENEYYTDYRHKNLIIRIYKPEFEWQAIGSVPREKLLDRGNFSQFYVWALLER